MTAGPSSPNLRAIFEAEFDYVCRTLRRLGVGEHDLEDAAQETFLAVHGQLATYDANRPLRPWLVGFALRIAANRRRKKRTESLDETIGIPSSGATPEEQVLESQAKTLALRVLDAMDEDRRDVFVMHELEDVSAPRIAELLAIPLNTVYSRLRTARAEFERTARYLVDEPKSRRSGIQAPLRRSAR